MFTQRLVMHEQIEGGSRFGHQDPGPRLAATPPIACMPLQHSSSARSLCKQGARDDGVVVDGPQLSTVARPVNLEKTPSMKAAAPSTGQGARYMTGIFASSRLHCSQLPFMSIDAWLGVPSSACGTNRGQFRMLSCFWAFPRPSGKWQCLDLEDPNLRARRPNA